MNIKHAVPVLAIALLADCGGQQAVQLSGSDIPTERWNATMTSPPALSGAVEMDGSAWMAEAEGEYTQVRITIHNASPGGTHPWLVQRGRCGAERGVFGAAADYGQHEVGADGRAGETAIIEQPLPTNGEYSIAVMASPTNRDLVVACGNLAPPVAANRAP
jgi:hypothetical protein